MFNTTASKLFDFPKMILVLILPLVLAAQAFFGYRLHQLSEKQEQLKTDFAEINSISLGLFSISQWQTKIERIVISQTRGLDLNTKQKRELQNAHL